MPPLLNLTTNIIEYVEPPLFSVLKITPFLPQKLVLERLLAQTLSESLTTGELEFLTNKTLTVLVRDIGIGWQIKYINNQLKVFPPQHVSGFYHTPSNTGDVTISGTARAFTLLLSRQEDPDTLFFQRILSIEGNTELGLEVKNLLDAIELDTLPTILQQVLKGLGRVATNTR